MSKTFRIPDLTAPRFRPVCHQVLSPKIFKEFIKKYPEYKGKSYKDFKKVITTMNEKFWRKAIDCREGIELPENIGTIFIGSCYTPQKENIDYYNSKKYNTIIKHSNLVTDGFLGKIFYTNYQNKYKFKHRELWKFDATRLFARTTSKMYKENWQKYVLIEPRVKINKLYEKKVRSHYNRKKLTKRAQDNIASYNEFEL